MNLHEAAKAGNMTVGDLAREELKRYRVSLLRLTDLEMERVAANVYGQKMSKGQVADVIRDVTGRKVNLVERGHETWIQAEYPEGN